MGEDENKKIAELYFGTDRALQGLEKIDAKLKSVSTNSENYTQKIKQNFDKTFDFSQNIDFNKFNKQLANVTQLSEKQAQKMVANIMQEELKTVASRTRNNEKRILEEQKTNLALLKSEQITADKKSLIAANLDAFKEKQAIKEEARNNKVAKSTKSMYDKIGDYAKTYLIYQGFNELKQSAKELVDEMVNVEYQMVQIDRVLNDSSVNINDYRDKLIQLAYDYGNSFDNVADITLRLAQAGFDAQESLALTEKTLLALNTAELNATQATSDMVAIMAQWGLNTGDAAEQAESYGSIIDKINKVADKFPTTSEDVLNALKKTSSAFNIAGASIDETIALITTAEIASQRGGKAIGTAMNNIITQLKDEKRLNIMESLGIDLYADDAKTEFNSIIDIVTQLSEKMQQLTDAGKENSTEMQELLSVFTIFRRNIGSGLLSGVAGEDSVYAQVLETSMNSLGYSIQENEKHMKTAKAAQEQFNAELLRLKTEVWDKGAEDVFRSLLLLGTDLTKIMSTLINIFGTLPVTLAIVILAFTTFNKTLKFSSLNLKTSSIELTDFVAKSKTASAIINKLNAVMKAGTITTNGLKVATIALNAAYSLGLSAAIMLVVSAVQKLVNAEEEAKQKSEEIIQSNRDIINSSKEEIKTIDDLITKYEELANVENGKLSIEQQKQLEQNQEAITNYLIEQNEYTAEMVGNYDKQLEKLREIRKEQQRIAIERARSNVAEKGSQLTGIRMNVFDDFFGNTLYDLQKSGIDTSEYLKDMYVQLADFSKLDFHTQVEALKKWKEQLEQTGKTDTIGYEWVKKSLEEVNAQMQELINSQNEYNKQLAENLISDIVDEGTINSVEDYKNKLDEISKMNPPKGWNGSFDDFRAIIQELLSQEFPEYQKELDKIITSNDTYTSTLSAELQRLDELNESYSTLSSAVDEFNKYGNISSATLQSLIDNKLLQYLDMSSGKLKINSEYLLQQADAAKASAIESLKDAAAKDIEAVATGDLSTLSPIAKAAVEGLGDGASKAGKQSQTAAGQIEMLAQSINDTILAQKGQLGQGVDAAAFQKRANAIANAYKNVAKNISSLNIASSNYSRSVGSGSKSATKTFEEQSEERVRIFKEEIDELESLEKSWVNKYKKLELFGSSDLKFITNQRISRYKEYLNQIQQLQGISEEDRLELSREYQSKLQEVELEYFDILKDELEDQIDALEKANDEKIKLIEEEADAQIEALKKVESENDRIREKEEYERKRNELIYGNQGIEYWRQRTGREAQQALMEAEQELKELDEDWNEKKEEWTLEDQIEEIEDARDAQIKAIEEAQETQIQAWKDAYQAQVDLYAQTGQIIYDGSVINAGYLYKAYMDNFVTPFNGQLRNVINSINSASAAADGVISKMKSISSGGGNTGSVFQALGPMQGPTQEVRTWKQVTTLKNKGVLESSDAVLNNKTSSSTSLLNQLKKKIGKFHGGGEVATAANEALAIVRKNEVVLRPEWAEGMNKLVKEVNKGNVFNNNTATNIKVDGDLIKLEAKVNSKKEADDLAKTIGEVLEKKFNIRK